LDQNHIFQIVNRILKVRGKFERQRGREEVKGSLNVIETGANFEN